MNASSATVVLPQPLLRGRRRPRVALVGRPLTGKSSLFLAASSASPQHRRLLRTGDAYAECVVDIGLEQISLVTERRRCSPFIPSERTFSLRSLDGRTESAQAIFQDGRCLATCDSVIVSRMGDGPNRVSAALRADLEALAAKPVS